MSFALTLIASVSYAQDVSPQSVEQGSYHWLASGYTGIYLGQLPNSVQPQACGGGDDYLVSFYGVPEDATWGKKVYATNPTSLAHIYSNFGLDGFYYCAGGSCTISVCTTEFGDPWSLRLLDW